MLDSNIFQKKEVIKMDAKFVEGLEFAGFKFDVFELEGGGGIGFTVYSSKVEERKDDFCAVVIVHEDNEGKITTSCF